MHTCIHIYIYVCVSLDLRCRNEAPSSKSYPLCGETLEPLARFVRKLPKDSNLAEDGFPGLINQEFLGSFSTD